MYIYSLDPWAYLKVQSIRSLQIINLWKIHHLQNFFCVFLWMSHFCFPKNPGPPKLRMGFCVTEKTFAFRRWWRTPLAHPMTRWATSIPRVWCKTSMFFKPNLQAPPIPAVAPAPPAPEQPFLRLRRAALAGVLVYKTCRMFWKYILYVSNRLVKKQKKELSLSLSLMSLSLSFIFDCLFFEKHTTYFQYVFVVLHIDVQDFLGVLLSIYWLSGIGSLPRCQRYRWQS